MLQAQPSLDEIRDYVERQLTDEIWTEEQRFENPHVHYLYMSPAFYALKMQMLRDAQAVTEPVAAAVPVPVPGK